MSSGNITVAGVVGNEEKTILTPNRVPALPPELLILILSFADRNSQIRSCYVSREWSSIALDYVWSQLDSLFPLLSILGDLTYSSGGWSFSSIITSAHWLRFDTHATRVRSLSYLEEKVEPRFSPHDSRISRRAFDDLVSHGNGSVLPQLRQLSWRAKTHPVADQSPAFITPRIHYLSLHFNFEGADLRARGILVEINKRRQQGQLETLGLNIKLGDLAETRRPRYQENANGPLAKLVRRQPGLRKVILHASFLTTDESFLNICQLPMLRVLEIMFQDIDDISFETAMELLGRGCPRLESIQLCLHRSQVNQYYFRNIRPLLQCRLILCLQLHIRSPDAFMQLTSEDALDIGKSWTFLKKLAITNWPALITTSENASSMAILNAFARTPVCKTLESLRLDFYMEPAPLQVTAEGGVMIVLKRMDVGSLSLQFGRVTEVIAFLKTICPSCLSLSPGPSHVLPPHDVTLWKMVAGGLQAAPPAVR